MNLLSTLACSYVKRYMSVCLPVSLSAALTAGQIIPKLGQQTLLLYGPWKRGIGVDFEAI